MMENPAWEAMISCDHMRWPQMLTFGCNRIRSLTLTARVCLEEEGNESTSRTSRRRRSLESVDERN
jgi:hypothetical protein